LFRKARETEVRSANFLGFDNA